MFCAFPPPGLQTSADYRRGILFLKAFLGVFFAFVGTAFQGVPNATCNAMKTSPVSTGHPAFHDAGVRGGAMAFPAVWKEREGDVRQESACALRAPDQGRSASAAQGWKACCIGGGRGAGHSGGHPGRAAPAMAERVGMSERTKLACRREAWSGNPPLGFARWECPVRRAWPAGGRCDVVREGASGTSGCRGGVALQAIPFCRGDLGLRRRHHEKKPFSCG